MVNPSKRPVVLVVEDCPMITNIYRFVFRSLDCELICASTGTEAIKLFKQHASAGKKIDLILMDLELPDMHGQQACKAMQALKPDSKVIVVSGYIDHIMMKNPQEFGFIGKIQKPFSFDDLNKTITQALTPS